MLDKPFPQSFWVREGLLCAGCYPGDLDPEVREAKLRGLLDCGIRRVVNLMEPTESSRGGHRFVPYEPRLQELALERNVVVECLRMPMEDARAPKPVVLKEALALIDQGLHEQTPTYLHCWGGHGRTGTVVACHLIQTGHTAQHAIDELLGLRAGLPKNHFPLEGDQEQFVRSWGHGDRDREVTP